jgi:hypothetical protein
MVIHVLNRHNILCYIYFIVQIFQKELDTPSTPKEQPTLDEESSIEENLNRLTMHDEEARTVDEALNMLK